MTKVTVLNLNFKCIVVKTPLGGFVQDSVIVRLDNGMLL